MSVARSLPLSSLAWILLLGVASAGAAETDEASVTVRRAPWGGVLEVKGSVVPQRIQELQFTLESWRGELKVVEAFAGGPVVAGQPLMRLDTLEIDRALVDAERELALARNGLEKRRREEALNDRERDLGREEALRAKELADRALARFETIERAMRVEEAVYGIEGTRIRIEQDREELEQLEKMIKSDELTEETEEIVLKRTKRALERLIQAFKWQETRHGWFLEETLPKQHDELRQGALKAGLRVERLDAVARLDLERRDLEMAKAQQDVERRVEAIEKLKRDREAFTLKAPAQGVVLAALLRGGVWEGLEQPDARYKADDLVKAGQALYTHFEEGGLRAEAGLKENEVSRVKVGQPVSITTPLTGKTELEGEVEYVASYGNKASYPLRVRLKGAAAGLRAGVSCTLKIAETDSTEVLSVPEGCLGPAEGEGVATLYVVREEGHEALVVKVGRKEGGRVEILSGIEAGVRVLKAPPKAKSE